MADTNAGSNLPLVENPIAQALGTKQTLGKRGHPGSDSIFSSGFPEENEGHVASIQEPPMRIRPVVFRSSKLFAAGTGSSLHTGSPGSVTDVVARASGGSLINAEAMYSEGTTGIADFRDSTTAKAHLLFLMDEHLDLYVQDEDSFNIEDRVNEAPYGQGMNINRAHEPTTDLMRHGESLYPESARTVKDSDVYRLRLAGNPQVLNCTFDKDTLLAASHFEHLRVYSSPERRQFADFSVMSPFVKIKDPRGHAFVRTSMFVPTVAEEPKDQALKRLTKLRSTPAHDRTFWTVWPQDRAFADAVEFVETWSDGGIGLPDIGLPDIGLADDGEVNFLWKSPRVHLDLGFYGDGTFSYYATTRNGKEYVDDDVPAVSGLPASLLDHLKA